MQRTPTLILAAIGVLLATPALSASRSFSLSGFDKLSASSHVTVVVRQGPYSVQVSEPQGRFDDLILEVRGGTLVVSRRPQITWFWGGAWDLPNYTITVSAPAWSNIEASSHTSVNVSVASPALTVRASDHAQVSGEIASPSLSVLASSHSDISGTLTGQAVSVRASDHAGVRLSGQCAAADISASSHAEINGQGLKCDTARIEASDHSGVSAWASRQAQARASSHASVQVYGQPPSLQESASDHASVGRM